MKVLIATRAVRTVNSDTPAARGCCWQADELLKGDRLGHGVVAATVVQPDCERPTRALVGPGRGGLLAVTQYK